MNNAFLLIAVTFAVVAVLLLTVVVRMGRASVVSADGVIVSKVFKTAGSYSQVPAGIDRGMRTPTDIPIAESYVFEIRADGLDQRVFFNLNAVASRSFEVGQRVRISYRPRGVPFAAKKYLVLDMLPLEARPTSASPRQP